MAWLWFITTLIFIIICIYIGYSGYQLEDEYKDYKDKALSVYAKGIYCRLFNQRVNALLSGSDYEKYSNIYLQAYDNNELKKRIDQLNYAHDSLIKLIKADFKNEELKKELKDNYYKQINYKSALGKKQTKEREELIAPDNFSFNSSMETHFYQEEN